MIVTALIIRAAATTVEFFATEAQALDAVKSYLIDDYGLDEKVAKILSAEEVSRFINEQEIEFEFTFEAVSAPAYRVTVTDLTTEVTLVDRLLHTVTLEGARESLGSTWNQFGLAGPNREAILWSTGQDEPVERINAVN